jgi:ribosomal protein S18 acetylase RimI-like enzyme
LWHLCELTRPWNDPHKDIQRKLTEHRELFLVGLSDGKLIATIMAGYEGHRGWINYLAVHPDFRRQNFARQLMAAAENLLRTLGCPKINLQVRPTNRAVIEFYSWLGYETYEALNFSKRLEHDDK